MKLAALMQFLKECDMNSENNLYINGREIAIESEKNLLEVIRKANIDLPTFCYHSELSVYGACRLCLVDVEGRGINSSCSMKPEPGMKIKTHTKELRDIRKINIELLLASHKRECTSCVKSDSCKLLEIASKLGVEDVRFKKSLMNKGIDSSSPALIRDMDKCILCGDCVRACDEIQGIGVLDFANRGSGAVVVPSFGKPLGEVECVDCGQCARVCPTAAITPKSDTQEVWNVLDDPQKYVVIQVAPAVRVSLGELFGYKDGENVTGQMISALKHLGFKKVFDTSFGADLTVLEEANEFLGRIESGENLPLITSCCPAWVKYAEQYQPEFLGNISSCKSPQGMVGALIKNTLPEKVNVDKKNIVSVSIMPCTAKKFEITRNSAEFKDVDYVLTVQELGRMIKEAGLVFGELEPESFDMPFGFKTGAGIIFGNSGGVAEAVVRHLSSNLNGQDATVSDVIELRGSNGIKRKRITVRERQFNIAVVSGLKNAKELLNKIKSGEESYDFIEVMACPSGCAGGAGQPVTHNSETVAKRGRGLYETDKMLQLHNAHENPLIKEVYESFLETPGSKIAHELLHTHYKSRKRFEGGISLIQSGEEKKKISVCVGTSCFVKGSQKLLNRVVRHISVEGLSDEFEVSATFCAENCDKGPTVVVEGEIINHCSFEDLKKKIDTFRSE